MLRQTVTRWNVGLSEDVTDAVRKEGGTDPLAYLSSLIASMMGLGPCVHPPALVVDDGVPQCLGCSAFL